MYTSRINPMMRESSTVLINNNVAEKAECSCKGRNCRRARPNQPDLAVLEAEDSDTMRRFYMEELRELDTAMVHQNESLEILSGKITHPKPKTTPAENERNVKA